MSKSLDPDQARQNLGPDLGPYCLQRFSTDGTSRQANKADLHTGIRQFISVYTAFQYTNLIQVSSKEWG